MTLKDLLWNKKVKNGVLGTCIFVTSLAVSKLVYDYAVYSNLKYIRKKLNNITFDEI